jgi:predicted N-formylglutamate amidohydrolase
MADGSSISHIPAHQEESYIVVPGRADCGLVVLCDHAGNALPAGYATLGLPTEQLQRHIAYDVGAADVARHVARHFAAPAVMTRYSRLLIDPNRGTDDPTLIMRLSDGAVVPGNRNISPEERARRIQLYYSPYHRAIDAVLDQCVASAVEPMLLSIHSFTESWKTVARPWHVGVLWKSDPRLAKPLLEGFRAQGDLVVGDNVPYSGQLEGDCLWRHGKQRGLANAIVEIMHDLIRDAAGQSAWGARLCRVLEPLLAAKTAVRRAEALRTWADGETPDAPAIRRTN